MSRWLRIYFVIACGTSLLLSLGVLAFSAGAKTVPWDVPDSRGRVFSFNKPMSPEHYAQAFRNATLAGAVKEAGVYGLLFVTAQLVGFGLVATAQWNTCRFMLGFFRLQHLAFPFGWLLLPFLPSQVLSGIDAESLTDGPPFWWWAQVFWVIASALIAFCSPLPRLSREYSRWHRSNVPAGP